MELQDVLSRVEERLAELGMSANRASELARKPDAIRNLRRAVQNGERRGITTETLAALAPVLKTTAAWLLEGASPSEPQAPLRVIGRIGAGAEILPEFEQIPPEGLFEISLPFTLPPDAVAFVVEGDSMWPRYDSGDIVICGKPEADSHALLGLETALCTTDGRRYLKTVRRGSKQGSFDLESHNAPPIRDVHIEWAARILMILPGSQWKHVPKPTNRNR
jgi:phage repressor protein C with HTH and peptisase S24 domain